MKIRGKGLKAGILLILLFVMVMFGEGLFQKKALAETNYPYLIKVNRLKSCVTIYEKDKNGKYTVPVKAMTCSAGWETPLGTFRTPVKYRWRLLMDDVWGQYSTRIHGGILFHSVWYYEKDPSTLSERQYNKLGTICSHGCVRLTVEDAKWIYDNCPVGTTVTIYDSQNPGPLGKPETIQLTSGLGWDPTDVTNPKNPYNNKKPTLTGVKSQTIKYQAKVDLLKGVAAKSSTGSAITSAVKVTGKVNTSKPGKYKVTYSVTDLLGRSIKKTVTFTVQKDQTTPVIKGVSNQTVGPDTVINKAYVLKNVTAVQGGKKLSKKNIAVQIQKTAANKYTVIYTATGTNGKKKTARCTITADKQGPVFTGIAEKEIAWDQKVDKAFVLDGVTVKDNITKMKKSDIVTSIEKKEDYYLITYRAKDKFGNETAKTVSYKITDYLRFEGIQDREINDYDYVYEDFVKEGVKAYNKDEDITSSIRVTISEKIDNQYTITYTIKDDMGHEEVQTAVFRIKAEEKKEQQ